MFKILTRNKGGCVPILAITAMSTRTINVVKIN